MCKQNRVDIALVTTKSLLFAKITGVHERLEELPTVEVVGQLDRLFKDIDVTTDLYTIEKIKTVETHICASVYQLIPTMLTAWPDSLLRWVML